MKKLFIILAAVALNGCLAFASEIDQVAEKLGDGVDKYCLELSEASRMEVRAKVNPTPAGNTIIATCN